MYSVTAIATILLTLSNTILAQTVPCSGSVTSSANRKIAIVIDSSGSNTYTDPNDLRIAAGKSLVANLASTDQVAVIDFDDSASVVSPLGAPSTASFDSIDSSGGTFIAGGVQAAIGELTKTASDPVSGVSGIIVLTDGEDFSIADVVTQINDAASKGIRVSFGFLNPDLSGTQDPTILAAIISSQGIYATINDATAQANFVSLVLSHGLVNNDSSGTSDTLLLPGLSVSGNVSAATSPSTFEYDALAAEVLNFTLTAITTGQAFSIALKKKGGADISSAATDASGVAIIKYTVGTAPENLELDVSTTDAAVGLFSVEIGSSVNRTINVCGVGNTTTVPNGPTGTTGPLTPTYSGTGTPSLPPFTAAANVLRGAVAVAFLPVFAVVAL